MMILPTSIAYLDGPTRQPLANGEPTISGEALVDELVFPNVVRSQKAELLDEYEPDVMSILTVTENLPGGSVMAVPVYEYDDVL